MTTVYDASRRAAAQVDPLEYRTTTLFDSYGRAAASQNALGAIHTTIADPLGRWTTVYDASNQVTAVNGPSHPNSHPMTNTYDAAGRRTELSGWLGRVTASYDAVGAQVAMVGPNGKRATWTYDAQLFQIHSATAGSLVRGGA